MSEKEPENGALLRYRVAQHGKHLDQLAEWRTKVDEDRTTVKGELANVHKDLGELGTAVDGIRRVLVGFALTIAGSSVVFALSVLIATGKL